MSMDDILYSEEGKVLEFKDPFKFFELPEIVQEEFLLKSDINSIKNLCNAAALSSKYNAVNFFEKLCNSYMFWRKKFRQDFPESYEETPKDLLIESGENYQVSYWREKYERELRNLLIAIKQGNLRDVKRYLELGADPNMKYKERYTWNTALMLASAAGFHEIVRVLLEGRADPNIRDNWGYTALMLASERGHTETVRVLLEGRADPNIQDENVTTALMQASMNGRTETVSALLDAGDDPNIQSNSGYTALMIASMYGRAETVRILLENGADPNIQSNGGYTALMRASQYGRAEIVRLLLEARADPNIQSNLGWTALMGASKEGHTEIVRLLLEAGADPNIQSNGWTALIWASKEGHTEIVDLINDYNSFINRFRRTMSRISRVGEEVIDIYGGYGDY